MGCDDDQLDDDELTTCGGSHPWGCFCAVCLKSRRSYSDDFDADELGLDPEEEYDV